MTDAVSAVQHEVAPSVRDTVDRFVAESLRLRMGAQLPGVDSSSKELLDALLDVRGRLDRMEELLAAALRLRGMAARKQTAVRVQVGDAWDQLAVRKRQGAVRDEYASAKEREAAVNVEILDLRRVERTADADARLCDEAVELVRLRLRGLQEVRHDLHALVKIRQFESSLDR